MTLAEQDPARVVAVLRLEEHNPMTEYGDIGGAIPTVLQAISEVSRDRSLKKPRYPATAWEALVEAGVVDALCACVADTKLLVNGSPASPKVPGSSAPSSMPSMPAPSPWAQPSKYSLTQRLP